MGLCSYLKAIPAFIQELQLHKILEVNLSAFNFAIVYWQQGEDALVAQESSFGKTCLCFGRNLTFHLEKSIGRN